MSEIWIKSSGLTQKQIAKEVSGVNYTHAAGIFLRKSSLYFNRGVV